MGSQSCRQQQNALDVADKTRCQSSPRVHNLMEVSPQTILDAEPNHTFQRPAVANDSVGEIGTTGGYYKKSIIEEVHEPTKHPNKQLG